LDVRLTTLLCKKITIAKFKEVNIKRTLAKYFREGYGSKRSGLPMMIRAR
jgi:hypothetical protein